MFSLSRRSMIKGTLAGAGIAALHTVPGARFVRAQGATYDIVSFGPVAEGVLPEGFLLPQFGSVIGVNPGGTGFGRVAASAEKFTPALFGSTGQLSKLKSGKFGGLVMSVNSTGTAVGSTYDMPAGEDGDNFTGVQQQPAAWIDGELVRLPVPDPDSDSDSLIGLARSISEDGAILGSGNGYSLLWTNEEPQILATQDADGSFISYNAITVDGDLIGTASRYIQEAREYVYSYGFVNDGAVDPFTLADQLSSDLFFRGTNSAGHALYIKFAADIYLAVIAVPGDDPIVVNSGGDGVSFTANGMNASNQVVGNWQARAGVDYEAALWQEGEFTPLESVLPANHGFHMITATGISDDGVISGSGYDEDGGFHPLLFIPA